MTFNRWLNNRINQVIEIYRRFGVWQIEDESNCFRKIGWKLKYFILILSYTISLIAGGSLSNDNNESACLIAAGITGIVATVKIAYILWKTTEIWALIQALGVHSVADYEEFVKVNDKVKKLIKFSSFVFVITLLCSALLIIFSIPIFAREKRLPINIWFPFDWKNNALAYWIAFGYVITATVYGLGTTLFNMIFWYLLMNCAVKYQILRNELTNVFSTKSTVKKRSISREEEENSFLQELILLIKTHQNIRETIDRFKRSFGNLFFTLITTSGIGICTSVYTLAFVSNFTYKRVVNAIYIADLSREIVLTTSVKSTNLTLVKTKIIKQGTKDESLSECLFFGLLLFYNFFDIFMVMYLGNEIKSSSDQLSYCLFESNWLERSKSTKKYIIILTEVLKQPHELLIGKLYPLNMKTFTSIVNFAYSMFNILKNLN